MTHSRAHTPAKDADDVELLVLALNKRRVETNTTPYAEYGGSAS